MMPINLLARGLSVEQLRYELAINKDLWNSRPARGGAYAHSDMSDIWVRYNPAALSGDDNLVRSNEEHDSVWYPEADLLPAAKDLCFRVMGFVRGERLGGVLITRVPAGGRIKPHTDGGWHAQYYDKFAVQVMGDAKQAFCFKEKRLVTYDGDLYTFDNQKVHWVDNDSEQDRITMIICIKTSYSSARVR